MTYFEALDEALCFGWIDGVRRSLDADSFVQRFTPRKPKSYWSAVNIRKAEALIAAKRMAAPGRAAFQRREKSAAKYSFESRPQGLPPQMMKRVRENKKASKFYETLPPGYLRLTAHWVTSAVKEETREQRLKTLIEGWAREDRYPAPGFAPMAKRAAAPASARSPR